MKLILSGGGSGKDTKEQDELFASLLDKSKPLLYIPIAIDTGKHPYPGCLKWLKSTFDKLSVKKYEMITEENMNSFRKKNAKEFSGIYIGGGNTPYLLKKIRETFLFDLIKEAIRNDVPIFGGSAGAIIFAKSITPSLSVDKNWADIKDFSGLKILDCEMWCHYDKLGKDFVSKFNKKVGIKESLALTEKNGLFIDDGKTILVGHETAWILKGNRRKKINVGEEIKIPLKLI